MRRFTAGAVVASLAVATAAVPGAIAKSGSHGAKKPSPRASTYRATLAPVAVGSYGLLAATRGKAQLVDGKKNNKISIHLRGVQPGETYTWHLHKAADDVADPCASPAQDAAAVAGWTFKPLVGNVDGNANANGRSKTFRADPDATYYVDAHLATGEVFMCGELKKKKAKEAKKAKKPAPAKSKRGGSKRS